MLSQGAKIFSKLSRPKKAGRVRQPTILWAKLVNNENSSWRKLNDKTSYVDPPSAVWQVFESRNKMATHRIYNNATPPIRGFALKVVNIFMYFEHKNKLLNQWTHKLLPYVEEHTKIFAQQLTNEYNQWTQKLSPNQGWGRQKKIAQLIEQFLSKFFGFRW